VLMDKVETARTQPAKRFRQARIFLMSSPSRNQLPV
jgi:hypothetical protein